MAIKEQKKPLTYLTGIFDNWTPIEIIEYNNKKKKRSIVTVITEDNQKLFLEVREATINKIMKLGIVPGDTIEIGFVFLGSEKGDRKFNNLFLNYITYAP